MLELTPADAAPPVDDPDRAKYAALSDSLRRRITDGYLNPGEELVSEGKMAKMTGVAHSVVRQALELLEVEGLIERRNGHVARVTAALPVRDLKMSRYQEEAVRIAQGRRPTSSAFADGHGIPWGDYTVAVDVTRETATPKDRELLDLPARAIVWRRSFVKYAAGVPVEIQRSALPNWAVQGVPGRDFLIDPARQPWKGGTQQELHAAELDPAEVEQTTLTRFPTPAEKRILKIGNVPILDIERVYRIRYKGRLRPVEASRLVLPGSRHRLVDKVTLSIP